MGKGEKASKQHCFQRSVSIESLSLYYTIPTLNDLIEKGSLITIWEKGENAGNRDFLPFPQ